MGKFKIVLGQSAILNHTAGSLCLIGLLSSLKSGAHSVRSEVNPFEKTLYLSVDVLCKV